MSSQTKIIIDALTLVTQASIRKNELTVLPRRVQIGQKSLLLDQSSPLSSEDVRRFLISKDGSALPFDADFALSAIRGQTSDEDSILIILPSKALDSIYEKIIIAKGMLKGQRTIEVIQAPTYGVGLKLFIDAVAEFSNQGHSPEIVKVFADRVLAQIKTGMLLKGKLPEELIESYSAIQRILGSVFGKSALVSITEQGSLQRIFNDTLLSYVQDQDQEILIEFSPGGEKFITRFLGNNPGLKSQPTKLLLKPEKFSRLRQVIFFHFLPSTMKIRKIADWATHWGQIANT